MTTDENKALVRRCFAAVFERGDLSAVDELVAPDYAYRSASGQPPQGLDREWLKRVVRQLRSGLPDVRITIEDMFAEGDRVVSRFVQRGTHRGDLPWGPMGTVMPVTGKEVTFGGIIISRIADGKVVEEWEVMEFRNLWQQLGALPALP